MSYTFKDNSGEVLAALQVAAKRGFRAIGMAAEGYAKRKITELVYSRGNRDKKYKLTGRLRNSITHAVTGETIDELIVFNTKNGVEHEEVQKSVAVPDEDIPAVYIGSAVEYAPYVEDGTRKMAARHFLRPAVTEHSEEYRDIMQDSLENA